MTALRPYQQETVARIEAEIASRQASRPAGRADWRR